MPEPQRTPVFEQGHVCAYEINTQRNLIALETCAKFRFFAVLLVRLALKVPENKIAQCLWHCAILL